jgi:hypothetical protein
MEMKHVIENRDERSEIAKWMETGGP